MWPARAMWASTPTSLLTGDAAESEDWASSSPRAARWWRRSMPRFQSMMDDGTLDTLFSKWFDTEAAE
ncbi:MAG: hypothetical protein R2838_13850 [Caldilineaceae bacterium]